MPEMLRIDVEADHLVAAIQVTLRIRTGYPISRIEVVRRALATWRMIWKWYGGRYATWRMIWTCRACRKCDGARG